MLSFEEAREKVIAAVRALRGPLAAETVELSHACGRVLAQPVMADRDYPPFDRSIRDGFALRADDAVSGATLRCTGEIKAGSSFDGVVGPGECVQIMTGAAVPAGADAVVMIEHVLIDGERVVLSRPVSRGQSIVSRGKEARAGQQLLPPGTPLGYAEMALAGQVGVHRVSVFQRARAAILSTGDEVVDVSATPGPLQVRNGNTIALEALAGLTGAEGESLGNAPDEKRELRRRIERGLEVNLLIISGGVSMGKYDLVEIVLSELGAQFVFDSVAIRPGRPAVFGVCRGKPVFGLPGNPVSTMVTFELFVVPAIDILSGAEPRPLPIFRARLAHALHERSELTHFLPARVQTVRGEPEVSALPWQGSGDVVAMAQSNAFLVVPPEKLDWDAGEMAVVLPRRGRL
ncbi:MAG: molybdopterin molybdenumtransferase MoeA [Acidobacteria bacterium]|nr:MAG: molybdopterin molybdenumtransferase MoeA [Acidobacteriota bacterium]